jgi:2-dehydropantoate 2-reductase
LWHKFALNCSINALTVKYQCRNGELLTLPAAAKELTALCKEVQEIASAIKPASWFADLATDIKSVLTRTADNRNSMLEDVRNQRETELSQLNGLLVQHAKKLGIAAPLNEQLMAVVLATAAQKNHD